jgi:hypothetical protein
VRALALRLASSELTVSITTVNRLQPRQPCWLHAMARALVDHFRHAATLVELVPGFPPVPVGAC